MYRVVKRDNSVAEFDIKKISEAIIKAFEATEKQYNNSVIDLLALKVTADFEPKIKDGLIAVEDIQDSVEEVLSQAGYADVAKAYILYRKQREKLRNMKSTILDYKETVNNYVNVTDWRVKENSTVTYSVGGLILSNSGAITANYWLSEVYDEEIANAHRNADIHIHDLSMLTGILRGFTVSASGKEYTECILHKYGHAHIGMIGMDNRQEFKLNKNLEALTEADLIYFDVRPIIKELPNSIEFLRVYVKKLEESYAQMWEVREIMRESAQARYAWFQRTYPKLQNIMQLKDVATFLGITPVTLSRIRARETISAEKDDAT